MIGWLLHRLGVRDAHPQPSCAPTTSLSERRYDRARRDTEQVLNVAQQTEAAALRESARYFPIADYVKGGTQHHG